MKISEGVLRTEIQNPKSLKPMEVHHHPEVEKKGIKEYLLEGLMIFLAVTMGFFAESLRENINEHHHVKEYAASLYSDLKADTVELDKYLKRADFGAANIDTLMQLLSAADPKDIPSGKLYYYGLFGGMQLQYSPNDATLLEIKSSGSLRYFSNRAIRDSIARYDQKTQQFKALEVGDEGMYTEVRKARALIFDFKYNDAANTVVQSIYIHYNRAKIDSFLKTNPPLLSTNKVLFNQYIEMVRSRFLKNVLAARAHRLRSEAINLMAMLKKEYEVEE
jgi:hypothetical protein